jgi:hypothetical protein
VNVSGNNLSEGAAADSGPRMPQTSTQVELAGIWAEALHADPNAILLDDGFATHGGRSLAIFVVLARVYEKFGVEFPADVMFDNPTIFTMAQHIDVLRAEQQNS